MNTSGEKSLKIIPLGGLGEIGMNMALLEYEGSIIIIDAGLMFPDDAMLGIDIVIPDFSYLRNPAKKVLGLFLTHGHEDHIGATPYLLREFDVPIYGTPLTLGFLAEKLKEHRPHLLKTTEGAPITPRLISLKPRDPISIGPFSVEAISVTHSVADSVAYGITTPVGRVVHTGDFKIDPTPYGGSFFDRERFIEYGEMGTLALLSDSTNAERPGHTCSERKVGETFNRLFGEIPGRIIVALFSSNIHRIEQIAQAAFTHGRKLFFSGKSVINTARIARELGYISFPLDQIVPIEEWSRTADSEAVLITTGSQGESMSALTRMANDNHKQVRIKPGDTVILSARVIPGNEKDISRVINDLLRKGAHVLHERIAPVHVSGHASQEEQKKMIAWTQPQFFIPVHGEYRQLVAHAATAKEAGLAAEQILIIEDGATLVLKENECVEGAPVPAKKIYVDGKGVGEIQEPVLQERLRLGSDGVIVATLALTKKEGKIKLGPYFLSQGFTDVEADPSLWKEMEESIQTLFRAQPEPPLAEEDLEAKVRRTLKKLISKKLNRYPVIIPNIIFL